MLTALILSAAAAWFSIRSLGRSQYPVVGPDKVQKAFRNSVWGMPLSEVERANGSVLVPADKNQHFFPQEDTDPSLYRSYEQHGLTFMGREAMVAYTFRDGRLFAYHVFVTDTDREGLDADMRRYLTRAFGPDFSEIDEEGSTLKLIWQSKDRIINYWFVEDERMLRPRYKAVFGVTTR